MFQRLLLRVISFCSNAISKVHIPWNIKKISAQDIRQFQTWMQPGDVLVSLVGGELANWVIPGDWSHAALVVDGNRVIEATTHGVVETDIIDFMMKKDYVALLRPKYLTYEERKKSVEIANTQKGKGYDFDFQLSDTEQFYCSELVWWVYQQAYGSFTDIAPFIPRKIMGISTIAPSDFANASDKFDTVWMSQSAWRRKKK